MKKVKIEISKMFIIMINSKHFYKMNKIKKLNCIYKWAREFSKDNIEKCLTNNYNKNRNQKCMVI